MREQARMEEDDSVSARSECRPRELDSILDSYFEEEPEITPVAALCTWPAVDQVEIPLPHIAGSKADRDKLVVEQQSDQSLQHVLSLAKRGEKGYGFEDQVLVQHTDDSLGDVNQRIVVPCTRQQQVLKLSHSNMHAGPFGFKKTFARISSYFLWPRMWGEIKQFVCSCARCQKAARNSHSRAPLQPLPCVAEPFEKVAFDLVGPLPRTSSGNQYILTMMCKYPEAIPLRRVDNHTVLEAMLEIFTRHGVPKTILTDQGTVFMSKLTQQLCQTLDIKHVRTSPYHPQSDRALERWHACLKGMMRRAEIDLKTWDTQLKFLLFTYRDTPHCVTGFSPFTLLFGREVKGPLSMLNSAWLEGTDEDGSISEWLLCVRERMAEMALIVSDHELKAKQIMKKQYDKTTSVKSFSAGEMVLVRKPGLQSKLGDTWDGMGPIKYRGRFPQLPIAFKFPASPIRPKLSIATCSESGPPKLPRSTEWQLS